MPAPHDTSRHLATIKSAAFAADFFNEIGAVRPMAVRIYNGVGPGWYLANPAMSAQLSRRSIGLRA